MSLAEEGRWMGMVSCDVVVMLVVEDDAGLWIVVASGGIVMERRVQRSEEVERCL